MTISVLNRVAAAVAIGAVALLGLSVPARAQPQKDQKHQDDQKGKKEGQAKKEQRLTQRNQQELMLQQEQRVAQYSAHLGQQERVAEQRSAQLQQQDRRAQYGYQQQYMAGLHQQQVRIQSQSRYDYGRDLYLYNAPSYRYSHGGRYYETNQYGVDVLRQAVNYGYEQGRLAGLADQQDRWPFNYGSAYAYQDANYGYGGFYVDRYDYNNYFREGFRRGYDDGYYGRHQYGTYSNGRTSILGAVLGGILVFEVIR